MNAREAYKQALSFFLFAVVGVLIVITETSYYILQDQYDDYVLTVLIFEWVVSIVLNFISSLFLIYVFYKIYQVVKTEAERAPSAQTSLLLSSVTNTESN